MSRRYQYYAIVDSDYPVDNPWLVVRTGGEFEEFFSTKLQWERSDMLYRIDSGREYFRAVPISEKQGKGFEKLQARRVEEVRKRRES